MKVFFNDYESKIMKQFIGNIFTGFSIIVCLLFILMVISIPIIVSIEEEHYHEDDICVCE